MKSIDTVRAELTARITSRVHTLVATPSPDDWPHLLTLGHSSQTDLQRDWQPFREWALRWARERLPKDASLVNSTRHVHGTQQLFPTHLRLNTLDSAAAFAGRDVVTLVACARDRWQAMNTRFPDTATPTLLRSALPLSEVDVALLLDAAQWFRDYDATGLTVRQVPIEGLHTKWLKPRRRVVEALSGKDGLGLSPRLSAPVHFHYRDPDHLAAEGRNHDSWTPGDAPTVLPYPPRVVLISENKDTATHFPTHPGLISVEGAGFAGAPTVAALPWLGEAHRVIYWGDIDAAGYEIAARFRSNGINAATILMDSGTYRDFERFGAWTDDRGNPIPCSPRKNLPCLNITELEMYERLTDPEWLQVRRIEQERIPLAHAQSLITATNA